MEETKTTSNLLGGRLGLPSISFLVGVLLFLLPFVEIRCNGEKFATNTGVGLAFGIDYKTTSTDKSLDDAASGSERRVSEREKGKLYVFALLAFFLGIAGIVLSLTTTRSNKALVLIGSLAAICLIALFIQLKMDVADKPLKGTKSSFADDVKVTAIFTGWYYLSLLSFIVAAVVSYKRKPQI
jgi:uncharacterized membrane protein